MKKRYLKYSQKKIIRVNSFSRRDSYGARLPLRRSPSDNRPLCPAGILRRSPPDLWDHPSGGENRMGFAIKKNNSENFTLPQPKINLGRFKKISLCEAGRYFCGGKKFVYGKT